MTNQSSWRLRLVLCVAVFTGCAARSSSIGPGIDSDGGSTTDAVAGNESGTGRDSNVAARDTSTPAIDGSTNIPVDVVLPRDVPPGMGASIEIFSGNGSVVSQGWPGGDPLKVIVLDSSRRPAEGVRVMWEVTTGGMAVTGEFPTGPTGTSVTDANGIARVMLRGEFGASMASFLESRIRASIPAGNVEFRAFSGYTPAGMTPSPPSIAIPTPEGRDLGTFTAGSVVESAVVVHVENPFGSEQGQPITGAGVRFVNDGIEWQHDAPSIITCANATEGTRAGGTFYVNGRSGAVCNIRVPSTPGTYNTWILTAGANIRGPYSITAR